MIGNILKSFNHNKKIRKEEIGMTREELMEFLQEQKGKDMVLNLQGIIITTIQIKQMQVRQQEHNLYLENRVEKVGFNLNQLMKISKIKTNEILLEFDPLQSVVMIIEKAIKI